MKEFPQYEPVSFWVLIISSLVAMAIYGLVGWLVFRRKRVPKSYDALCWVIVGAICVLGAKFFLGHDFRLEDFIGRLTTIVWWATAVAILVSCVISEMRGEDAPTLLSKSLVWFIPFGAIYLLAMPVVQGRGGGVRLPYRYCYYNLMQVGLGLHNYHDAYEQLPFQQSGKPPHSWRVDLLPFLEQQTLHDDYDFDASWDGEKNVPISMNWLRTYSCPSIPEPANDAGQYYSAYAIVSGENATWTPSGPLDFNEISDGTSHTVAVVEACGQEIIWTEPRDVVVGKQEASINAYGENPGISPSLLSTYHKRGANVLFVDGSVRTLSLNTSPEVIEAMVTANGGETVAGEF